MTELSKYARKSRQLKKTHKTKIALKINFIKLKITDIF